ncbi:SET domain-containing protein 5 [Daldinia childiae]|uniref:SET domain-containing protein 5 n=1 Tax=Daldinia childiae TaxID=326645 RepID=UPI0014486E62|nr:SET domain-containing protein 5 [Daldinia childiae]KAF3064258.1 SET domain-containing protein 5 [Daldinia childiae]
MVEVRQLASIGEAIFAKVNISRGTRIAAETPLITVPPINSIDEELWELCNAVDKITDGKSKELEKLPYSSKVVGIIKKGGHVDNRVWCFYKNRKLKNSDGKLLKGKKLGRIVNRTINLCMIYLVNNVQLGPGGKYGSGIFPLYTRINHSCVPNAYNSWNPTLERLTIHAIHDIKAGEQIFVDYIGKACRTRNQRNFSLHTAWDITCNCAACTDDRLDQLRYRMLVLDQALAAYECGASEEAHLEGIPKLETNEQALKAAEELVKLFKKQRLCGMELCKT